MLMLRVPVSVCVCVCVCVCAGTTKPASQMRLSSPQILHPPSSQSQLRTIASLRLPFTTLLRCAHSRHPLVRHPQAAPTARCPSSLGAANAVAAAATTTTTTCMPCFLGGLIGARIGVWRRTKLRAGRTRRRAPPCPVAGARVRPWVSIGELPGWPS